MLAAGLFGIVHGQIGYTVSDEYFTKFKFIQFGVRDAFLSERVGAGLVGFLASWWMGIPLGLLCGAAGFVQRSPALMGRAGFHRGAGPAGEGTHVNLLFLR